MVLGGFGDEIVSAGFSAKPQAQVPVADEPEAATTIRAPVFWLGHDTLLREGGCSRLVTCHIGRRALRQDFRAINVSQ
jgi:hypothetical protein